jgi:nucleotide-binding universal stress UspA family protein
MERIMVAVDGSAAALKAIDFAAALAARLNPELILVETDGREPSETAAGDPLLAAARFEAWANGAIRLASLRLAGDPGAAILRCAAEREADLIVLGRDRASVRNELLRQLLAEAACAVAVAP